MPLNGLPYITLPFVGIAAKGILHASLIQKGHALITILVRHPKTDRLLLGNNFIDLILNIITNIILFVKVDPFFSFY